MYKANGDGQASLGRWVSIGAVSSSFTFPVFQKVDHTKCSVLCPSALCFLGLQQRDATSRFYSSDGWWVKRWGVSSRKGSIKRKEKRDLAQRLNKLPWSLFWPHTKKNSPSLRWFFLYLRVNSKRNLSPLPSCKLAVKAPTPACILSKSLARSLSRPSRD